MVQWLFDSEGIPIAFLRDEKCYTLEGQLLGLVASNAVWDDQYLGEIVEGDRLLRHKSRVGETGPSAATPDFPTVPTLPSFRDIKTPPPGFEDLGLEGA